MPSYRLFLSLSQTSFFLLFLNFSKKKKPKTWDAPLFSLWGTNELWMWVNQRMEVAEIAGWFFQPENKGRALECDGNMSFPWKDPSLNVILRWGGDALSSWWLRLSALAKVIVPQKAICFLCSEPWFKLFLAKRGHLLLCLNHCLPMLYNACTPGGTQEGFGGHACMYFLFKGYIIYLDALWKR